MHKIDFYLTLLTACFPLLCIGGQDMRPLFFDFGPRDSTVSKHAVLVTEAMRYSSEAGFGWLEVPDDAFIHDNFERSREAFNIDGVQGQRLEFQVDAPAGEWLITVLADAGYEDVPTVKLSLNDQPVDPLWLGFKLSAEPGTVFKTTYRVFQSPVRSEGSLRLLVEGGDYEARLLGVSLIPKSQPQDQIQLKLTSQLNRSGQYPGDSDLSRILEELNLLREKEPQNSFYAYWFQQVALLHRAEDHFKMRGWEKYTETTGLSIWGQLNQAVMILDGILNHSHPDDNPLYERACFLRGRILYWLGLQRGGENEIARGHRDLKFLRSLYPKDDLLAMYTGEKVDLPDPYDEWEAQSDAPVWSIKQRELLGRMRGIAHWWVLEQQADNGEFGGKLGDDVELLRWWTPLLLAGDRLAYQGWSKLADEVFRNRKVYKGYSRRPIDVEHASEFIADTAPLMVVVSDASHFVERLKYSADYFQDLWTGETLYGNRFFRSSWYSSTDVDERPPRNRDHEYNSRAAKAVRYYAWKTQDGDVLNALHEWSAAWLRAANLMDKGKPKGILPASVRFPDEAFNGDQPNWYEANMFWDYFEWEANAGTMILDQLLFSYTHTRDDGFLDPLLQSLELIERFAHFEGDAPKGSEAWAAKVLEGKADFWRVAAQWRVLTEDSRFDALLMHYGTPYLRYRLSGNDHHLEAGLERVLENVRYNTPLKTFEAIHTDRVYVHGYEHLTMMLTGNESPEGLSPFYAVTWEQTHDDFTALLKTSDFERLVVQLYSHSERATEVVARVWQLDPGSYHLIVQDHDESSESLNITSPGQRVNLKISPNELINVEIRRK